MTLPDGAPHSVPVWIDGDESALVRSTQIGRRRRGDLRGRRPLRGDVHRGGLPAEELQHVAYAIGPEVAHHVTLPFAQGS